ncbi:fucose permease [Lachnospiraceae bacterium JC7]|nr:fucose permease [Lachnospiraceae bacterium JC7]
MGSLLLAVIYLIFISLGLPDSLLGSGWPKMQMVFDVPSSYAGYVSMTICFMTIISALISPGIIRKIHTKWIVIASIILTILGLLGFSFSRHFFLLFLFAVPYGLGAGAIDASVNHYVASNYSGSVMNFLHCFYGVGAVISPSIMALALRYARWNEGYRWTAYLQIGILLVCVLSLPLWDNRTTHTNDEISESPGIIETLKVPGVSLTLIAFFAYCSGEATCFLWTPSYFAGTRPELSDEVIASYGSLIFGGLMLGRLISGFISNHLGDRKLIRIGIIIELIGIGLVGMPNSSHIPAVVGFVVIGTGMGPVYPSIQHMAPHNFGKRHSASVIGLQMASAYVGSTFMPMAFGHIQENMGIRIMPAYLLLFALLNLGLLETAYKVIKPHEAPLLSG